MPALSLISTIVSTARPPLPGSLSELHPQQGMCRGHSAGVSWHRPLEFCEDSQAAFNSSRFQKLEGEPQSAPTRSSRCTASRRHPFLSLLGHTESPASSSRIPVAWPWVESPQHGSVCFCRSLPCLFPASILFGLPVAQSPQGSFLPPSWA